MSKPDNDKLTLNISDPAELITALPYLVGHQIHDSIVVIGLADREMQVAARTDIDTPVTHVGEHLQAALSRLPNVDTLLIVGYATSTADDALRALAEYLRTRGHTIGHLLRVAEGRYHCLGVANCTPPEGAPLAASTAVAASLTYRGLAPLADRAAIDALPWPTQDASAVTMRHIAQARLHLASNGYRTAQVHDAMARAKTGQPLTDDQAAQLCLALHDDLCRDTAWRGTDDEQWQFELWLDLTRRCEPTLAAPAASLLAWCAWRRGNGPVATAAVRRAVQADPTYPMAMLIIAALQENLPPSAIKHWPPTDPGDQTGPA